MWVNIGPLLWHSDDRNHGAYKESYEADEGSQQAKMNEDKLVRSHPHTHSSTKNPHPNLATRPQSEDQGIAEPGSFELSDDEVIALVSRMGFEMIKHEVIAHDSGFGIGYMQDPTSLLQHRYRCSHWVARKL